MSDRLEGPGRRAAEPMAALASPCVGLCRIEDPGDLCTGCGRSRGEIAAWGTMAADIRRRVWAALPGRRARLGIDVHRLPWGAAGIRRFVEDSLHPGGGTWVFGPPGAEAAFSVEDGEAVALNGDRDAVEAATARGAVRFAGFERMRALAFGPGTAAGRAGVLALVVPRGSAADVDPSPSRAVVHAPIPPPGPHPHLLPAAPVPPAGYALVALHHPDPSKDHHAG